MLTLDVYFSSLFFTLDLESDAVSLKDFVEDRSPGDTGKRPILQTTAHPKETSHSKSANEVMTKASKNPFGKAVSTLKSQSVTKVKGQSSQSMRIKESSSNMSLSSKTSKSTSSLGINISSTAISQSDSRLALETMASSKKELPRNESLRWENVCSDSDEEQERLKLYKLNRRKRYLAAANKKYSDWIATLSGSTHSLSTISNHHMEGDYSTSTDSIKHSNSGTTNSYMKTINTIQEGFVPGVRQDISLRSSGSQMMLNC